VVATVAHQQENRVGASHGLAVLTVWIIEADKAN
jgi:hypothetical protein